MHKNDHSLFIPVLIAMFQDQISEMGKLLIKLNMEIGKLLISSLNMKTWIIILLIIIIAQQIYIHFKIRRAIE